ncbi:phosphotransferase [Mycoplasma leonicaptivi]|uniref:phosphotransferase n=1 Tax=Mycoplasma leonicaptivi TaxID=36742 RepID=UPI000486EAD5|nr:phosphotransferase [Mycoplasma leonicaptivi]
MEQIKKGFTNKSYKNNNTFYQEKNINLFNHKIEYELLKKFSFVPKLINNSQDHSEWEWIKTKELIFDENILKTIANQLKELHDSNLKFSKSNIARRIKEYRKILNQKGINIQIINDLYKRINLILSKSQNNRPLHNDLYTSNILSGIDGKIYFIDWEYAAMGDKHFDLAYFICGSYLTKEQEQIFLDEYDSYWPEYLLQQKILVYYLTILWVNAQDVKPFDDNIIIEKLKNSVKEYEDFKNQTKRK